MVFEPGAPKPCICIEFLSFVPQWLSSRMCQGKALLPMVKLIHGVVWYGTVQHGTVRYGTVYSNVVLVQF